MQLNADFQERVVINTAQMPWVNSPIQGVQRRMLDRDGEEVARATTIVRFAPQSSFSPHSHGGGEEFLVLEGVFSDENGDYPAGSYVRNPIGSTHTPYSDKGCTILVKLWQFAQDDQQQLAIDTNKNQWLQGLVKGLEVMPLHNHGSENVALVKWDKGTFFQRHSHWGGEEIYVIKGVFADEHGTYPQGTWIRNPHGSIHTPYTDEGCIIYVKTGHLN